MFVCVFRRCTAGVHLGYICFPLLVYISIFVCLQVVYGSMDPAANQGPYNYHYPQHPAPKYSNVPSSTGGKVYPGDYPPYPGYAAESFSPCKQQPMPLTYDASGYPTKEATPVKEKKPKKPEPQRISHQTYMALAFVVMLCFNCPIGLLAVGMAYYAQMAFREGDKTEGERRANIALCCSMLGILATIFIVIGVVWYSVKQKESWKFTVIRHISRNPEEDHTVIYTLYNHVKYVKICENHGQRPANAIDVDQAFVQELQVLCLPHYSPLQNRKKPSADPLQWHSQSCIPNVSSPALPCEAKRQYLLTFQVSRYCLVALRGSVNRIIPTNK